MSGIMSAMVQAASAAPPATFAWNPSLKGSGVTLSAGDTIGTRAAFGFQPVVGVTALSGTGYFDVSIAGTSGRDWQIGVANASLDLNNFLSSTADGCGIAKDGVFQISTGNITPSIDMTLAAGNTVRVGYTGNTIRYSKDGGSTWTQYFDVSSVAGTRYPAVALNDSGAAVTAVGAG